MTPTDHQLLLATCRGHEPSARLLWARHAPRLLAHARAILRHRGSAEDVVQAVMCRVLELSRSRLGQIDDVPAFLAGAVRHEALNHLRSARRELARLAASGDPGRSATDHHATELNATELMRAIDTLPRRQREIIVLKHSADLTFDQIALALSTNRNTIAARYRVAITALRNLLAPIEPGPPGAIHV